MLTVAIRRLSRTGASLGLPALFALALLAAVGCNLAGGKDDAKKGTVEEVEQLLATLQVNLQKHLLETVCVLVVVDNTPDDAAGATAAGGEELTPEQLAARALEARLRRERLVRAELTSVLVRNTQLKAVDPPQVIIDEYYKLLKDKNANALSAEEAKKAGDFLRVQALITAFIEDEGKKINVVATQAEDGKVVFNEILVDWNFEKSTGAETGAEKAPAGA